MPKTPEEIAAEAAAAATAAAEAKAAKDATNGFPSDTTIAEMTDAQQAAYWKFHARKHEAVAESRKDFDAHKTAADELAALKVKNLTADEKAIADARKEGETTGAGRYLTDAVQGRLLALTGKTEEELAVALDLIDVTKLTQADGTLDLPKITAYATTLGLRADVETPNVPPTNPVKDALDRQTSSSTPVTGGSIAEATRLRVAALTPTPSK